MKKLLLLLAIITTSFATAQTSVDGGNPDGFFKVGTGVYDDANGNNVSVVKFDQRLNLVAVATKSRGRFKALSVKPEVVELLGVSVYMGLFEDIKTKRPVIMGAFISGDKTFVSVGLCSSNKQISTVAEAVGHVLGFNMGE